MQVDSPPLHDRRAGAQLPAVIFIIVLLILSLSGCFAEFEENIYGTWITQTKIDLGDLREPEYEYIVFLPDDTYQTNIFKHLYVTGDFVLFQEDDKYYFQLEYEGASSNETIFQYKFIDDSYSVLKIKSNKDIVTVFEREKGGR